MEDNRQPATRPYGSGLNRPECVVTHRSGWVFASDWTGNGGISAIAPNGRVFHVLARGDQQMRPNGIALEPGGSFLLAHLGAESGGVFRLWPNGRIEPVLTEVAGRPLPPSNFPLVDGQGRLWLSISTTVVPRAKDYSPKASTGMIVLQDQRGARVVADNLGYANEIAITPDGQHLFVNETFARRLTRFRIAADGELRERTVIVQFGPGTFPDGVALDVDGCAWITSIVSNRVIRIWPDGRQEIVIEDSDPAHLDDVERAFQAGEMGRPHLDNVKSRKLRNISCLAFGGTDLRTAYLGCLLGDELALFHVPSAGVELPSFSFDISPLTESLKRP